MKNILYGSSARRRSGFRSNGSFLDFDCDDLTDWVDDDNINGVSEQLTFDNKSCIRLDTNTADSLNRASRKRDVGSLESVGNRIVISFSFYADLIGTVVNTDFFRIRCERSDWEFKPLFSTDGIYLAGNEIGTNLVELDTWQEWSFDIDLSGGVASAVCDVYLNSELKTSNFACADTGVQTDGQVVIRQYGYVSNDMITYLDWIKIGDNFG